MKKHFICAAFSLFLFTCLLTGLAANDFTPYVSQIRVEARDNLIRLTWIDSPDVRGPVYIFRSARPFSGSIPANLRPVIVRYGEQSFVDDTDDMQNLYYFIAASDTAGQRYDIILPRINSTSLILAQSQDDETVYLSAGESAQIQEGIYNLRADQNEDRVIITFEASDQFDEQRRNAILYRSTQPVQRPQDLLNAVIVRSRITSPFIDYPVPGLVWYYAVIYEDEIASGDMGIKPGINATVNPVIITGDYAAERSLRPIPLPVMTLHNTVPQSFFITEIPGKVPLSAQTESIINSAQMPGKPQLELKRPRVFAVDLVAPTGGEESALFQIVTEYFTAFEWEAARTNLQRYLSLPRSREVEARARFYLGQTLYFTANYREALMEFLTFRSFHLPEANSWIEAVLSAMVY
ncbi:MAG: hypothetical protein FWD28_04135 [Treponema sp.]|nr:hypothetical protein [Treponema sp.]